MADITVDVWQDFELGGAVNATNLNAHDHIAVGSWAVTDASSKLSVQAAAEKVSDGTFSGNSDASGATGLQYNTSGGSTALVQYTFSANKTLMSGGFWLQFSSGLVDTFGEYDLWGYETDLGTDDPFLKLADQEEGTGTGTRIHAFTPGTGYSTGITVSAATWYWVTWSWQRNNATGFKVRVYDTSGAQVGSEQTRSTTGNNDNLTDIVFGPQVGGPSYIGSVYFDDLVLDFTDATFPLGPPVSAGNSSSVSPSVSPSVSSSVSPSVSPSSSVSRSVSPSLSPSSSVSSSASPSTAPPAFVERTVFVYID